MNNLYYYKFNSCCLKNWNPFNFNFFLTKKFTKNILYVYFNREMNFKSTQCYTKKPILRGQPFVLCEIHQMEIHDGEENEVCSFII